MVSTLVLLLVLGSAPADACEYPQADFSDLESHLFEWADQAVIQSLNDKATGSPQSRAMIALERLKRLSVEINQGWPEESRFQFQILDISPVVLVKMTYRNRATFSAFAVPDRGEDNKPNNLWKAVVVPVDYRVKPIVGHELLSLFPLERGQAKRARFLAKFGGVGCGSGQDVAYYAYEWNPQGFGSLNKIVDLKGAVNQEEPPKRKLSDVAQLESFVPIGSLQTRGPRITLPYCWFSAIDTWNNPSLCATDSYDLSGDRIRFIGTVSNRPDIVPVAKAIEYAQARDNLAVSPYCATSDVARQIVRDIPPSISGVVGRTIKRIGTSKERIEIGDEQIFRFDVQKIGDRWLIISFHFE